MKKLETFKKHAVATSTQSAEGGGTCFVPSFGVERWGNCESLGTDCTLFHTDPITDDEPGNGGGHVCFHDY